MDLLTEEYRAHIDRLLAEHDRDEAMHLAVGGSWDAIAAVEEGLLRLAGLRDGCSLVDVGCGSGRLASRLHGRIDLTYLGTDVCEALLEYAREQAPGFTFQATEGLTIPAEDASVDVVCFFSVLTHLPHEAGYLYLIEANRVLRPGGVAVVSFLELTLEKHWPVFQGTVDSLAVARHHNQFTHREDLAVLAQRAGYDVERVASGIEHVIPIDGTYVRDDGEVLETPARLGQSWMLMRKPA